jgi:iron complex outermembrane receptor protein
MKQSILRYGAILGICAAPGFFGMVRAEGTNPEIKGLEEIIVTAERRSESSQTAPIALTVITGQEIADQGISQPEDLNKLVPGLTLTNTPITNISIRGVGAITEFDSLAQLGVTVATDGVFIDRVTEVAGNFFDLSRVEVLLGPQGTLYGRNATGGAVNLITNKPTQTFGGDFQEELGNFNLRRTTGAVNVPVSNDLALRFAFYDSKRDGYLTDGFDDEDMRAGRIHALWTPNNDISLLLTFEASRIGGQGVGNVFENMGLVGAQYSPTALTLRPLADVPGPNGPEPIRSPYPSYQDFDNRTARAQFDWNLGFATLTVIPGYRNQRFSYQNGTVQGGLDSTGSSNQYTGEVRLSHQDSKWTWTVGAFSLDEHVDFSFNAAFVFFDLPMFNAYATADQFLNTPNYDTRSDAAFGELTYSFTDRLRGIFGARYTTETNTGELNNKWYGEGFNIPGHSTMAIDPLTGVPNFLYAYDTDAYQHAVHTTGKAGLEYDLAPKSLLYATVSTGFKGGGFGLAPPPQTEYKPEYLTAYTLGIKNRFFNDTLQFNAELYLWDYKDQQVAVIVNDIYGGKEQITVNAGSSTLDGLDLSLLWAPTAHDRFGAHAQYEHAVFGSYNVVSGLGASSTTPSGCSFAPTTVNGIKAFNENCAGLHLPFTPHVSGIVNYAHTFVLPVGSLDLGGDVHFATEQQTQVSQSSLYTEHGYGIFDANLEYAAPKGTWSVTGYVRNIANRLVYDNQGQDNFSPAIPVNLQTVSYILPPRTFGVILKAHF